MKKFLLKFLKNNWIMLSFILIAIIIETTAVIVTANAVFISNPLIFLTIVLFFSIIIFYIRNNKARFVFTSAVIGLHGVCNIFFIIVYEMTGQMFDYSMITLRKDAMAILESVPLNVAFFFTFGILFSAFVIFGGRFGLKDIEVPKLKRRGTQTSIMVLVGLGLMVTSVVTSIDHGDYYDEMLYSSDANTYKDQGILGNALSELASGVTAPPIELGDISSLNKYLYKEDSIQKSNFEKNNYNVITVLCESFEWISIVENLDVYPNGLNYDKDQDKESMVHNTELGTISEELFPNLYKFYKEAIVMTNFHSKEKTDIAENLSYLGSYPTRTLTNYSFKTNNYATSMANMLKKLDPNIVCNSFHNGEREFYNRGEYHKQVGFDNYYATEDMLEMGYTNLWEGNAERNLDGEMIDVCKDLMFPTNKRFYTYIITITQHGQYKYRPSLEAYYKKLKPYGYEYTMGEALSLEEEFMNEFTTYIACTMELDRAIGKIEHELKTRFTDSNGNGVKDENESYLNENTIITLFGDHNVYYNGISNKVKGFTSEQDAENEDRNYLELYRVPYMIKYPGNEHKIIDKFCTTADIVPTIYDILGINLYGNFFYGNSVFNKEESILYSKAYGFFATENTLYSSLNNFRFTYGDYDLEDISKRTIKIVDKIKAADKIYYNDYFNLNITNTKGMNDDEIRKCFNYADLYYYRLKAIQ